MGPLALVTAVLNPAMPGKHFPKKEQILIPKWQLPQEYKRLEFSSCFSSCIFQSLHHLWGCYNTLQQHKDRIPHLGRCVRMAPPAEEERYSTNAAPFARGPWHVCPKLPACPGTSLKHRHLFKCFSILGAGKKNIGIGPMIKTVPLGTVTHAIKGMNDTEVQWKLSTEFS